MLSWSEYFKWLGDQTSQSTMPSMTAPSPESLVTDSRDLKPGQWFVPLIGETFDGHKFIAAALEKGASGFFYAATADVPAAIRNKGLAVHNTLIAFQRVAQGWRRSLSNLQLLAITGSSGKTTTKEMVACILKAAGNPLATQGSFNNEIGVSKTLLRLTPEHDRAILEFGARHIGDIRFLTELAEPNIVCLLNVGTAHLGIFGSAAHLLTAKLEIFRHSPPPATLVALHDDARILNAAIATGKKVVSFGLHPQANVRVANQIWLANGTIELTLALDSQQLPVTLKVAHEAYAVNAAAAATLALAAGVTLPAIKRGLEAFIGIKGRYQVHRLPHMTLIDDCYNANPESMKIGFKTVARAFQAQRKVIIIGDMLELGDESPTAHRQVGTACVETLRPALIVTVGEEARLIAAGAQSAGQNAADIRTFKNVDELLAAGDGLTKPGDLVYVKASNGIKLSKYIDHILGHP